MAAINLYRGQRRPLQGEEKYLELKFRSSHRGQENSGWPPAAGPLEGISLWGQQFL